MMKFHFDIKDAGYSSDTKQKLTQATRMACIAWAMADLGHSVTISRHRGLEQSTRWSFFSSLSGSPSSFDVLVFPAEILRKDLPVDGPFKYRVGFKCSPKRDDNRYLQFCDLLVAHEYDHCSPPSVDNNPRLLPISWPPYDGVVDCIFRSGLAEAYMRDDLPVIRNALCEKTKKRKFGFIGNSRNNRTSRAKQLPGYLECKWTDGTKNISPREYIKWSSQCEMCLHLPGDTPKSTRFSELAMLGIPIVMCHCPMRDTPLVTSDNTILLRDYDDHASLELGYARRTKIIANADASYREGWSLRGQAVQILRFFGEDPR